MTRTERLHFRLVVQVYFKQTRDLSASVIVNKKILLEMPDLADDLTLLNRLYDLLSGSRSGNVDWRIRITTDKDIRD